MRESLDFTPTARQYVSPCRAKHFRGAIARNEMHCVRYRNDLCRSLSPGFRSGIAKCCNHAKSEFNRSKSRSGRPACLHHED